MSSIYYFTYGVTGFRNVAPIILAARDHDVKRVNELLSGAENVINDIGPYARTALHIASMCGHSDIVGLLMKHGADVNIKDKVGMTALHFASQFGDEEVVKDLINKANINDTDEYKRTPLYLAGQFGHLNIVLTLLAHEANASVPDLSGQTAADISPNIVIKRIIHRAMIYQRHKDFLMFLANYQFLHPPPVFPRESSVEKVFVTRDLHRFIMRFL